MSRVRDTAGDDPMLAVSKQHLRPYVWQVLEQDMWSFRKSQLLPSLVEKRYANKHSPDINHVWIAHRLSIEDQRRIEECWQKGGDIVEGIRYKDHDYFATLRDPSGMCIRSMMGCSDVFPRRLRRIHRFMSGVRSMVPSQHGWLQGWLDRPYEQEWPTKPPIIGSESVITTVPSRFDDEFEFPAISFRIQSDSIDFRKGDQVSYRITQTENGLFEATDLKLEYEMGHWGIQTLNRNLHWGMHEIHPFVPEKLRTEIWQIRAMAESERETMMAIRAVSKSNGESKFRYGDHATFTWKTLHPRMMDCLSWISNNPAQSSEFPWFAQMDACDREQFVDFKGMIQYSRSNTDASKLGVSRIRRVNRFKSQIMIMDQVQRHSVCWLNRSVEQTSLFDAGYEYIPLLMDTDDCSSDVRKQLKCSDWVEYSLKFMEDGPVILDRQYYAFDVRLLSKAEIRLCKEERENRLKIMSQESLLRNIRGARRMAVQRLNKNLKLRLPRVNAKSLVQSPMDHSRMVDDLAALIDGCDLLLDSESRNLSFKHRSIGDWDRHDVLNWIASVDHGRFVNAMPMVAKRVEVYRIVGTKLDYLLDPHFNRFNLGLRYDDQAEVLSQLTKGLLNSQKDFR